MLCSHVEVGLPFLLKVCCRGMGGGIVLYVIKVPCGVHFVSEYKLHYEEYVLNNSVLLYISMHIK